MPSTSVRFFLSLVDNKGVGMWGAEEFKGKKVKIYWNKEHKEA
jgi:hypothetical protein